jgi:mannose/fructose/N-acetylgalactosamine-specific phosphotransferase system component IID
MYMMGFLAMGFLVCDIAFVFWAAIREGGTITVGDTMPVLMIELFLVVPLAITFMMMWLMRRRLR